MFCLREGNYYFNAKIALAFSFFILYMLLIIVKYNIKGNDSYVMPAYVQESMRLVHSTTQLPVRVHNYDTVHCNRSRQSTNIMPELSLKGSQKFLSNASCVKLGFSPTPLPITALASQPDSGNTWTRHLIQQLTGKSYVLLLYVRFCGYYLAPCF